MDATVLITGATSGLGRWLAVELSNAGWTVLVHGRDPERTRALAAELDARAFVADLGALDEVRGLAERVADATPRLDVLVNNAGVGFGPPGGARETSRDGHELRLAIDYLAPVVLTRALLPLLRASTPARIVNVGSVGQAPVDLDDLEFTRGYDGVVAYRRAKLALAAWTFDLAAELSGTGVTANVLHPASLMPTNMVREARRGVVSTVDEGGRATLRLITDPQLRTTSGVYFDGARPARAHADAYDAGFRARLAEATERLLAEGPPAHRGSA
ncbi:3-oxoacyl-ACP reductase [Virgisporangium aliadipatigenens]|uniref:3-oxoacyl-ACP reductase n=1 Tax=Virgisporangium aliadipatigenens TaxID=741659 RepID=A0A8J3YF62_9ACTN|nr:SDR family NAD(P)-dependent oxidoreductase [Virgisporangium aliadipatigenens]GIJ43292.1 3-oxoacyl-ACP reductase [Virgisporangium aliadipatigenens]